ncbi:DNA-binding response regulator [Mycetocola manganoxydans]|uniref:DNA-binding response regulator n=1 Tax=Mycetocola manganoxydans TaxID=699879 RepID=A0A3L7A0J7_9MICO|nr:response regulator transcription factor [Mycetocola manganoxydans]RLP72972.1 DNA-binding response regulator [Mycetocola manganoxydans]GHD44733.1 DNA-binding response regulator [Mycetocola manganoxydans]
MTPTRVLLADDHEMVRAGFRIILGSQPGIEIVGEAATGAEALARAAELKPDVICMDVQMPDMDGLEATRRIVADESVTSAVLILTTFDRDDYLFEALGAGASGFLLKNSTPEQLIDAVRVVASGDALLAPAVTRRVIERFGAPVEKSTAPVTPPAALETLTDREAEVLQLVAQGLSNAEIATQLFVGEATVKSHVSKVLQKLGLRDRIQAVVWAYENRVAVPGG